MSNVLYIIGRNNKLSAVGRQRYANSVAAPFPIEVSLRNNKAAVAAADAAAAVWICCMALDMLLLLSAVRWNSCSCTVVAQRGDEIARCRASSPFAANLADVGGGRYEMILLQQV